MGLEKKRALTILSSWLEAAGIPHKHGPDSLVVSGETGDFPVKVIDEKTVDATQVGARDLLDSLDGATQVFWLVTERAGRGKPVVVDRGDDIDRVRYSDDPELVAMRHREFRQVSNLPARVYEDPNYRKIIVWYCRKFHLNNQSLCQRSGYDAEDIQSYAWIYLTNFYGRWRHLDQDSTDGFHRNEKMFCSYLQQRLYSDLKPLLERKARSISIDAETAEIGLNVKYVSQFEAESETSVKVAVTAEADVDFEEIFEEWPHERVVEFIDEKVNSGHPLGPRLRTSHERECMDCGRRVTCRHPEDKPPPA